MTYLVVYLVAGALVGGIARVALGRDPLTDGVETGLFAALAALVWPLVALVAAGWALARLGSNVVEGVLDAILARRDREAR